MSAALIVSVSGVGEPSLGGCVELAAELHARVVPVSWLFRPRPRDSRHRRDAPVVRWLRQRVVRGDALVLHGFDHTIDPVGRWATSSEARRLAGRATRSEAGRLAGRAMRSEAGRLTGRAMRSEAGRLTGRAMRSEARWSAGRAIGGVARVARRAEFAALPSHEATLRLIAAMRVMDELGLPADLFAPPRWLASEGTLVALRRRGFRVCADDSSVRVFHRRGPDQVLRGRVRSVGSVNRGGPGSTDAAEAWRHRALVASAARTARRGGLVRLAVDAAELARPGTRRALLDAVDAALTAGAVPASYRLPVPAPTPVSA